MYMEYNLVTCRYMPRFGNRFIHIRGHYSFADMRQAVSVLKECGLAIGKKTASRTWEIIPLEQTP